MGLAAVLAPLVFSDPSLYGSCGTVRGTERDSWEQRVSPSPSLLSKDPYLLWLTAAVSSASWRPHLFDSALRGARVGLAARSTLQMVDRIALHPTTIEAVRLAKMRGHFGHLHP